MENTLRLLVTTLFTCTLLNIQAQPAQDTFKNPIISGFHPDPSIVRVDEDYYLVNSSFEWFPGIPIFHSKDLVNWEQLGYVLDRPSQLRMENNRASSGVWAPTIRYHEGLFYVSVTCKHCKNDCNCGDNFFVTAEDPAGPWSEPTWIDGSQKSIDPTLVFDEGKVWYLGNRHHLPDERWKTEHRIFVQEMDLSTGKLLGEPVYLTSGHATNAKAAEGPHIYKRNGQYLLMISEGGTWVNHAITTFTSDRITGPYEPTQVNPALTHRHLGNNYPITTIGHADLVEDTNGQWWSVMLGVRPQDGFNILGRETFLTPVSFQGVQPIFNIGKGKVLEVDKRPALKWSPFEEKPKRDDFDNAELGMDWNFLRTPKEKPFHKLANGELSLSLQPEKLTEVTHPALIARRIEHYSYTVSTRLSFAPKAGEEAGLVLMQNDRFHYRLVLKGKGRGSSIALIKAFNTERKVLKEQLVAEVPFQGNEVVLSAIQNRLDLKFSFGKSLEDLRSIGDNQNANVISSNKAGGFTGPYAGMYASSNGAKSKGKAVFDWFEYESLEEQVFEEKDGKLHVEAEHYHSQSANERRHWFIMNTSNESELTDNKQLRSAGASKNAYLEISPDTRTHHKEKLVKGLNFSNQPGKLGILNYKVKINTPGRYYVWVRAYSTGSEDNGIHVGLDREWPASGQRMQWCEGKNQWTWESKQRTQENHCGEPGKIFLDIEQPGIHTISFSMREDGFEFDAWAITKEYKKPGKDY